MHPISYTFNNNHLPGPLPATKDSPSHTSVSSHRHTATWTLQVHQQHQQHALESPSGHQRSPHRNKTRGGRRSSTRRPPHTAITPRIPNGHRRLRREWPPPCCCRCCCRGPLPAKQPFRGEGLSPQTGAHWHLRTDGDGLPEGAGVQPCLWVLGPDPASQVLNESFSYSRAIF